MAGEENDSNDFVRESGDQGAGVDSLRSEANNDPSSNERINDMQSAKGGVPGEFGNLEITDNGNSKSGGAGSNDQAQDGKSTAGDSNKESANNQKQSDSASNQSSTDANSESSKETSSEKSDSNTSNSEKSSDGKSPESSNKPGDAGEPSPSSPRESKPGDGGAPRSVGSDNQNSGSVNHNLDTKPPSSDASTDSQAGMSGSDDTSKPSQSVEGSHKNFGDQMTPSSNMSGADGRHGWQHNRGHQGDQQEQGQNDTFEKNPDPGAGKIGNPNGAPSEHKQMQTQSAVKPTGSTEAGAKSNDSSRNSGKDAAQNSMSSKQELTNKKRR